jgi:acyl carrier protein
MEDPRVARILAIMAKETFVDRDKLVPEATIESLGIASLDVVQTVFAIEEEFDIQIPVAGGGGGLEFATVKALLDHVIQVLDEIAAAPDVPRDGATALRRRNG